MKIFVLTILYGFLSIFCLSPSVYAQSVYAQSVSYALIGDNCALYIDEQTLSPLFYLPSSYFVKILQESDGIYKVSYLDVVGYVKTDAVSKVDYEPKYKFPQNNATTVHNDGNTVTMRSSATHLKDNVIAKLDDNSLVTFYGLREGSSQIETLGNNWCYVKNGDNYGYVYNLYVKIPTFEPNDYTKKEEYPSVTVTSSLSLSPTHSSVIIIALCALVSLLLIMALKTVKARSE